jgi:hypothetical protein
VLARVCCVKTPHGFQYVPARDLTAARTAASPFAAKAEAPRYILKPRRILRYTFLGSHKSTVKIKNRQQAHITRPIPHIKKLQQDQHRSRSTNDNLDSDVALSANALVSATALTHPRESHPKDKLHRGRQPSNRTRISPAQKEHAVHLLLLRSHGSHTFLLSLDSRSRAVAS